MGRWIAAASVVASAVVIYFLLQLPTRPTGTTLPLAAGKKAIELSRGTTAYKLTGSEDAPLVVLVHGFSLSILWDIGKPYDELLASKGYRVLTFDLYGRGSSAAPDATYDAHLFVGQLVELLFKLKLDRSPFVLVGASMGGLIATRFTQLFPEKVSKLILLAPAGFAIDRSLIVQVLKTPIVGDLAYHLTGRKVILDRVDKIYPPGSKHEAAGKIVKDYFIYHMDHNPSYLPSLLATIRDFPMGDMPEPFYAVGAIQSLPVLLIWGDKDETVPFSEAPKMAAAMPNARLAVIPDGPHDALVHNQEEVQNIILNWLQETN